MANRWRSQPWPTNARKHLNSCCVKFAISLWSTIAVIYFGKANNLWLLVQPPFLNYQHRSCAWYQLFVWNIWQSSSEYCDRNRLFFNTVLACDTLNMTDRQTDTKTDRVIHIGHPMFFSLSLKPNPKFCYPVHIQLREAIMILMYVIPIAASLVRLEWYLEQSSMASRKSATEYLLLSWLNISQAVFVAVNKSYIVTARDSAFKYGNFYSLYIRLNSTLNILTNFCYINISVSPILN